MKKGLVFLLVLASLFTSAQEGTYYIAAKNGLSMREQPNVSAKQVGKIPYGEKVNITYPPDSVYRYHDEGLQGMRVAVNYNGKPGYIVDNYLLPTPPPKPGVTDLKQYLEQLSTAAGAPIEIKKPIAEIEGGSMSLRKQLYKNGAEYHLHTGYESHTYTFFLPDYSLQQAFVLLRFLSKYKTAFSAGDPLPVSDATIRRGDKEILVKVEKEDYGNGIQRVVRLKLAYEEGAYYDIEVFELGSQTVVYIRSGV